MALGAGDAQCAYPSRLDVGAGRVERVKHELYVAGQQVLCCRPLAFVRHVGKRYPGLAGKQLGAQMVGTAQTGRAVIQFSRIGLGVANQLLYVVGGHRRMNYQHIFNGRHKPDRRKIFNRVVGQLGGHGRVGTHDAAGTKQNGIAVGCRFGDELSANRPSGANLVFYYHGSAQTGRQARRNDAGRNVCRPTSGEGHDQLDGLGGLGAGQTGKSSQ